MFGFPKNALKCVKHTNLNDDMRIDQYYTRRSVIIQFGSFNTASICSITSINTIIPAGCVAKMSHFSADTFVAKTRNLPTPISTMIVAVHITEKSVLSDRTVSNTFSGNSIASSWTCIAGDVAPVSKIA